VIEAESQAVLNTITEQDFQDGYKNQRELGTVHTSGKGLLRGWWWPVGPNISIFDQTSISLGNYG
jgi:hypothetical protein